MAGLWLCITTTGGIISLLKRLINENIVFVGFSHKPACEIRGLREGGGLDIGVVGVIFCCDKVCTQTTVHADNNQRYEIIITDHKHLLTLTMRFRLW